MLCVPTELEKLLIGHFGQPLLQGWDVELFVETDAHCRSGLSNGKENFIPSLSFCRLLLPLRRRQIWRSLMKDSISVFLTTWDFSCRAANTSALARSLKILFPDVSPSEYVMTAR